MVLAAFALLALVAGQPECELVVAGMCRARCIPEGPEDDHWWPAAHTYHSAVAFAQHHGKGQVFWQEPTGKLFKSTISALTLGPVQDFPARNFQLLGTRSTSKGWANTLDGEWTAFIKPEPNATPLTGMLRLGTGGHCFLAGLSVYRPSKERLMVRLNFDGCDAAAGVHRAAVALGVRRTRAGGSDLARWMCALMDRRSCARTNASSSDGSGGSIGHATVALDLRKELGEAGHPAVRRRLAPLVPGCFEPFDWIEMESAAELGSEGAALSLSGDEWELLQQNLPVVSAAPVDADFSMTLERVCVDIGGVGGSCEGTSIRRRRWWKLLLASVLAADVAIAITVVAMLRHCQAGADEEALQPLMGKAVMPGRNSSARSPADKGWAAGRLAKTGISGLSWRRPSGNDSSGDELAKANPGSGGPPEQPRAGAPLEASNPFEEELHEASIVVGQGPGAAATTSMVVSATPLPSEPPDFDPEEDLLSSVAACLEKGPLEVSLLVASLLQHRNIHVEGDFRRWLVVKGFTLIPFDQQKAMVSLPPGGLRPGT